MWLCLCLRTSSWTGPATRPARVPPCPLLAGREFLELGFKYDNLLMEESAQILEIETFIPMLLQVGRGCRGGTGYGAGGLGRAAKHAQGPVTCRRGGGHGNGCQHHS